MTNPWLHWWTDNLPLWQQPTFPRLLLAMLLGAIVGAERQWRQRAAGVRTNTLVCFGAAAFVDLGATLADVRATSIIAYVVSGVGFLGAGAIMKEGGSIRGLNTAATLWCSAAVGACAGAGEMADAVFVTVLLVTINIALRPVSRFVDRKSMARMRKEGFYRLIIACLKSHEQEVSALIMRELAARPLTLREMHTEETDDSDDVIMRVLIESDDRNRKQLVADITRELNVSPNVTGAEWAIASSESD